MTRDRIHTPVTDELLVAYLDGELSSDERQTLESALARDEELRARLKTFQDGEQPWEEAFEGMLQQAPLEKLEADLAAAIAEGPEAVPDLASTPRSPVPRSPLPGSPLPGSPAPGPLAPGPLAPGMAAKDPGRGWRPAAVAACVAFSLLAGFGAGYGLNEAQDRQTAAAVTETEAEVWRQAVADYQALYTRETLSTALSDPLVQTAGLQRVSKSLGLALPFSVAEVGGLDYKRAQILKFGDKPLAQLAYLYEDEIPIAFCIVRLDEADRSAKSEVRSGLNIVHWVKKGYSLMLVGDLPLEDLNRFARELEGRVIWKAG